MTVLERLEKYGEIMIMDAEDRSYMIFVTNEDYPEVEDILKSNTSWYESERNDYGNWGIDFRL